jgi:hypothetical protein
MFYSRRYLLSVGSFAILGCLMLHGITIMHAGDEAPTQPVTVRKLGAAKESSSESNLRKRMEEASQAKAQKGLVAKSVEPSPSATGLNLYGRSLLLEDSGSFTLIPLGAILSLPASHKAKVVNKPTGTFLIWDDFKKENSSWLATQEVSLQIARGKDPKALAKLVSELSKKTHLVVAVHEGNPISILEEVETTQDGSSAAAQ